MIRTLVFAIAVMSSGLAFAEVLEGRIVAVSDGDTVTLLDAGQREFRVRLSGIDAPYMQVIAIRSR